MTQAPDEREAIVRWLRAEADVHHEQEIYCKENGLPKRRKAHRIADTYYTEIADAIERGDHLSEQGEG